ncbi:MAG: DUF2461 domain-containing protein [Flavobacteriales bacterium]|nr:DUF2461 domain-containing protein [Flavobacteriales bacterium]
MAWFTDDFNRFFKDLAKNNHKEWFDANRKRYEASVKQPFHAFVLEVIRRVHAVDKRVHIEPKDAIFRINRDIRFSNDKTPYKLHCAAIVSPEGRKDHGAPGIYVQLGPEHVAIYGGSYMPARDEVQRIRERIAGDLKWFKKLREAPDFVRLFGEVQGERNKIIPADLKAAAAKEPVLYNKQFYYGHELPSRLVTDPKLADIVLEHYHAMRPMNEFLLGRG